MVAHGFICRALPLPLVVAAVLVVLAVAFFSCHPRRGSASVFVFAFVCSPTHPNLSISTGETRFSTEASSQPIPVFCQAPKPRISMQINEIAVA